MIPLSKLRKMRERRAKEASVAAACDAQECGGVICTAEDPRTCRVHGIASLEREDLADKHKGEIDLSDAHCLRDIANSMSMKEADAEIAKHFSCVFDSVEDAFAFVSANTGCKAVAVNEVAAESLSVADEDRAKTKRCVAATIRYIHEKFPMCKLPTGMTLLLVKNIKQTRKGQTVCSVSGDGYAIAIGFSWDDDVNNGSCYGHGDYRNNFDHIRHELFHAMEAERGIVAFYERIVDETGRKVADAELRKVSDTAYRYHGESEAECFAKITSSDYANDINEKIEAIVKDDCEGGAL